MVPIFKVFFLYKSFAGGGGGGTFFYIRTSFRQVWLWRPSWCGSFFSTLLWHELRQWSAGDGFPGWRKKHGGRWLPKKDNGVMMCKMLMDFIPGINPDISNLYHDIYMIFPMTYYSMIDSTIIDGSMTFTLKREVTYSRFKGSWVPMIFPFPQGGICCLTASGLRSGLPSLCGLGRASSTLTLGRTGRRQTQAIWSVGWMERQID